MKAIILLILAILILSACEKEEITEKEMIFRQQEQNPAPQPIEQHNQTANYPANITLNNTISLPRYNNKTGCIILYQEFLDQQKDHLLINQTCLELESDVNFKQTIVLGSQSELDCMNYRITGTAGRTGIRLQENASAKNCMVIGTENGFELFDNTKVTDSTAANSHNSGFILRNDSTVWNSDSRDNNKHGFDVADRARSYDCSATENGFESKYGYGFYLQGKSISYNIQSNKNLNGLMVESDGLQSTVKGNGVICENENMDINIRKGFIAGTYKTFFLSGDGTDSLVYYEPCD